MISYLKGFLQIITQLSETFWIFIITMYENSTQYIEPRSSHKLCNNFKLSNIFTFVQMKTSVWHKRHIDRYKSLICNASLWYLLSLGPRQRGLKVHFMNAEEYKGGSYKVLWILLYTMHVFLKRWLLSKYCAPIHWTNLRNSFREKIGWSDLNKCLEQIKRTAGMIFKN